MMKKVATEDCVLEQINVSKLKELPYSQYKYSAKRITGVVRFDESSVSGVSQWDKVKTWIIDIVKIHKCDIMFDVLFYSDSRFRATGYMYSDGKYGSIEILQLGKTKTYVMFNGVWSEQ